MPLDHDDCLPQYVPITPAKLHDAKVLSRVQLKAGSIVALDRGHND